MSTRASGSDNSTERRQDSPGVSGKAVKDVDGFGRPSQPPSRVTESHPEDEGNDNDNDEDEASAFHDAHSRNASVTSLSKNSNNDETDVASIQTGDKGEPGSATSENETPKVPDADNGETPRPDLHKRWSHAEAKNADNAHDGEKGSARSRSSTITEARQRTNSRASASFPAIKHTKTKSDPVISEWSHQQMAPQKEESDNEEEVAWQAMPAIDEFDVFDDDGRLVAKGLKVDEDDVTENPYMNMSGRGKGYTRVLDDEDAKSTTSLDEDTNYLFKKPKAEDEDSDDEEQRDMLSQLQATKHLLTEGQRIAYVGVVRLTIFKMVNAMENVNATKSTTKILLKAAESVEKWGQQMMVRLYKHMDISPDEQLMIEQLAEHGLEAADLAPPLMVNAKVKNPMADVETESPPPEYSSRRSSLSQASTKVDATLKEVKDGEEVPDVHGPQEMTKSQNIDLDLRWTVLCDLFLVLVSDSIYDARSRRLLERVATVLKISWIQICRFEKKVTDQLEMEEAAKENWDESTHMEDRRKRNLKRKYMVMGLATVGGGLVIGLSAGLLAPVIGAGLAAGFTTIGVTGTAGFLGGTAGAAIITTGATLAGGHIAIKASSRRTGHVKTFEYRPLHNNKRVNLILTVAGWMTGKVDDVRLPFSTVDPVMGDIYSLYWEPEMLTSMGDTINILATEALTQGVQQILGSTILVALMASLQLPIVLSKLAYLIDNPWTVSCERASAAGLILADSLMARHLGQRPITLVGYSIGARVIFTCLQEMARRGAFGLIQNVYLFGAPVVGNRDEWLRARSVTAGRLVNAYATNDWILGYLFRATSGGIMRVAGLAAVKDIPGLENLDVSDLVNGHMAYRAAIPKLLKRVGWEVESEEFTEIEDPDPENHAKRQRQLLREIEAARIVAEQKPDKRMFGLFKRAKLAEKQNWEIQNAKNLQKSPPIGSDLDSEGLSAHVLFDIDAIRKELLSEQIEIRELQSTLPTMSFTTVQNGEKQIEYLRLPPEVKAEEVAKMNLPPRPADIDNGPTLPLTRNGVASRTTSSPNLSTSALSSDMSNNSHTLKLNSDVIPPAYDLQELGQPRELVSTLPPLRLVATASSDSTIDSRKATNAISRPGLKSSHTASAVHTISNSNTAVHREEASEPNHNAWDEQEGPGNEKEITMTFE